MDKSIYFALASIFILFFGLVVYSSSADPLHMPVGLQDYITMPQLLAIGVVEPEALEVSESTSIVQDEQLEPSEPSGSESVDDGEAVQDGQIEEIVDDYPAALGTPYDWPEWLGDEPDDLGPLASTGEDETAVTFTDEPSGQLARIEYHLSIISGGVILLICSLFTWYTIIKPLKRFIMF